MRGRRWVPWVLGGISLLAIAGGVGLWRSVRAEREALAEELRGSMREEARALEEEDPMPPPEENAATLYLQALAALDTGGLSLLRMLEGEWDAPPAPLAAWVAANGPALRLAERGAALDRCRFPADASTGAGDPTGALDFSMGKMSLGGLPGILTAEARIDLSEGRLDEAVRKALLVTRVARHRLHRSLDRPGEIETDLRRVADLLERALHDPALGASTARRVARGLPDWREIYDGETSNARLRRIHRDTRIGYLLSERVAAPYEDVLRREFGMEPRSRSRTLSKGDLRALRAIRAPDSFRYAAATRPWPHAGRLTVLRAAFAVRAFVLKNGRPPADLSEPVPDLLPAVPEDPFADGPLLYECDGNRWSVRSRGTVQVGGRAGQGGLVDLDLRIDSEGAR